MECWIRQKSDVSFTSLVRRYLPFVYACARRQVVDRDQAMCLPATETRLGADNSVFTRISFRPGQPPERAGDEGLQPGRGVGQLEKHVCVAVHGIGRRVAHDLVELRGEVGAVKAAVEACRLRLRPILMTSFAFILGVLPLVLATGAGAEMRQALGTAVFFGMIGVTIFGLLFTPVFYVILRAIVERRQAPNLPAYHAAHS